MASADRERAAPGPAPVSPDVPVQRVAAPGELETAPTAQPIAVSKAALITAGPVLAVLLEITDQVQLLRTLTPRSDVPDALEHVARRLRHALTEAATADAWVTVETAATARGLSASAVRWRIGKGRLRAEWRGGRWWVHRADVEAM